MKQTIKRIAPLLASAPLLATALLVQACSLTSEIDESLKTQEAAATKAFDRLAVPPKGQFEPRNVQVVDDFYIAFQEVATQKGDPLPPMSGDITYVIDRDLALFEHLALLREITGLRYHLDENKQFGQPNMRNIRRTSGMLSYDASGRSMMMGGGLSSQIGGGQGYGQPYGGQAYGQGMGIGQFG